MNPKRVLIALALSLFASGMCTWFAFRKVAAPAISSSRPVVFYAAPSRPLQPGEVLSPANTEQSAWAGAPIDGAFLRLDEVNGRTILYPLAKGEPILDRDISAGSGIGLATRIPTGMRAVALRSDEVVGVAGFLLPGSHVDVLVTYRGDHSPDPLTATVLENAVVLATGHQVVPDPDGKSSDTTVVTLLLTPEESQLAVLAAAQGAIHFVLRNAGDMGYTDRTPALVSQLVGNLPAVPHQAPRSAAPPAPATARQHSIEVILGDSGQISPASNGGAGQ